MDRKLNVCLLGAGRIASLHLHGYIDNPHARIYSVWSMKEDEARKLAKEIPYEVKLFTDIDKALSDPMVDIVEILSIHSAHENHVLKAFQYGKHVSCQKVPALTIESFDKMVNASKKAGKLFRVYENFRYHPPYSEAMKMVKSGAIGNVKSVNYRMWSSLNALSNWQTPINSWRWRITEKENYQMPTLFDDGYHKHSIIAQFFGDLDNKIESVRVWSGRQKLMGLITFDVPAVIIYETKHRDMHATWNVSLANHLPIHSDYYGCDEYVEVQGDKGIIFIPGCTGKMFEACTGGPGKPGIHWIDKSGNWHSNTSMETNWKHSFDACTRSFVMDVLNNKSQSDLQPDIARYILKIALGVVKSNKLDGQKVLLDSVR